MQLKLLLLAALATLSSGLTLTWLEDPYTMVDEVSMIFYKPLIWYVLILWLKTPACNALVTTVMDLVGATSDMTDDELLDLCTSNTERYWEQLFYGGDTTNQPYDFSWAWESN
jgi:hypothetical protein